MRQRTGRSRSTGAGRQTAPRISLNNLKSSTGKAGEPDALLRLLDCTRGPFSLALRLRSFVNSHAISAGVPRVLRSPGGLNANTTADCPWRQARNWLARPPGAQLKRHGNPMCDRMATADTSLDTIASVCFRALLTIVYHFISYLLKNAITMADTGGEVAMGIDETNR